MEIESTRSRDLITSCKSSFIDGLIIRGIFSEFDTYIQKAKKSILDTRNHSALKNVANELQDVQKIMGK